MDAGKIGKRKAEGAGVPQAWVWSHYQGRSPQIEREHEEADQVDPMLFEGKGLYPIATAIGLAIAVAVILGLVWLFTPNRPTLG
jgi:hypothetical protein